MRFPLAVICGAVAAVLAGCGLRLQSPDVFEITRDGPGGSFAIVVNDSGTISCDRRPARPIAGRMLIEARALAVSLDPDAVARMRIARTPGSVYSYTIRLPDGTVRFPDVAAARHSELGTAEEFVFAAERGPCAQR